MSISLQKYNTKSTFLRKPNEERIMSRSFLSYGADFRTPWESQILRKSRKKKIGRSSLGLISAYSNPYLGLFRLIQSLFRLIPAYSILISAYLILIQAYSILISSHSRLISAYLPRKKRIICKNRLP